MEAFGMSVVIGVVGCRVVMPRIGLTVAGFISGFVVSLCVVSL